MSNPPALLLHDQISTSYLAREQSVILTPATTVSPVPNLNIGQSCCCVSVRGVCSFLVFLERPGGAKGPKYYFRKRPGHTVNAPGLLFTPEKP